MGACVRARREAESGLVGSVESTALVGGIYSSRSKARARGKEWYHLFWARARRSRYVEVLLDVVLGDGAFVAVSTIFTPVVPIVSFYGVAFEVAPGGLRYRPFSHLYLPSTLRFFTIHFRYFALHHRQRS